MKPDPRVLQRAVRGAASPYAHGDIGEFRGERLVEVQKVSRNLITDLAVISQQVVHSVLLGNGCVSTISFFGLDRMDNLLRDYN